MLAFKAATLQRQHPAAGGQRLFPLEKQVLSNEPAHAVLNELTAGQIFAFHKTNLNAFIFPNVYSADKAIQGAREQRQAEEALYLHSEKTVEHFSCLQKNANFCPQSLL